MAEEGMELPEGTTPESDAGTAIPKFKSAEDRDKAYLELEKQSHATAQELAEMKRKMEDFVASQQMRSNPEPDRQEFTDVYKSQDDLKKFWENFAARPQEVFKQRDEALIQQIEQRIAIRDAARDAVSAFKGKHPDLAPYEEIVSVFVQRQPTNLTPRERLERAAPEARKMIASIAQKGGSPAPKQDADTFVEAPSQHRESAPSAPAKPQSEEDALSEYMRERAAFMAKKQQPPIRSK